jgi:tetratricopeptide (TPR) repeat protein
MSRPSKPDHKKPEYAESFEEQIDLLFEELSFAVEWQRPSILLVFYESEHARGMAEIALEEHLAKIGQQVVPFKVDEKNFDIPLLLSQRPDLDHSVYSVTGLSLGGGKEAANAYRALNMRREYFVDFAIRVIIWLAEGEAIELSRHAPDFWAFRHRVVVLNDSTEAERFTIDQTIRRAKQGILIARRINDTASLAKLWGQLGVIYRDLNQLPKAIRAYWKAIRINPQDSSLWIELGQTYLVQGRMEAARSIFKKATRANPLDVNGWINLGHTFREEKRYANAIIAYQQAIRLDVQNSSANSSLVACFRLLGKDDLAEEQVKRNNSSDETRN